MRHKILFLSSWYPNRLEPTNGNFVQRHAESVATKHDVQVIHAIGDPNLSTKLVLEDNTINGIRTLMIFYKNTKNPVINFLRRMKAYQRAFKKIEKPELVHANVLHNNLLFAVYLKKRFKIPFVVTEHWTMLQTENQHKAGAPLLKVAKIIAAQAEMILPVSQNLLQGLKKLGIMTPMKVISNVVDTDVFTINNQNNTQNIRFLHVSSLVPRKKAPQIILVAKKLHDNGFRFQLEIGGDGDFLSLQKQIVALNAEEFITTFGPITYQEVATKMQHSDCFILFSENETQGCVILESLACGKPVISTKVGGVPEFVKEGFGILIPENDEQALYESMAKVIQNSVNFAPPQDLRNYVVSNFSVASIAHQFDEVYDQILKKV